MVGDREAAICYNTAGIGKMTTGQLGRQETSALSAWRTEVGVAMADSVPTDRLLASLIDEDEAVRLNAAIALAEAGNSAGLSVLLAALRHESAVVRLHHATSALVTLGAPVVPALLQNLAQPNPARAAAALALYRIDTARKDHVVTVLLETLNDPDDRARHDAASVLERIGEPAAPALPVLRQRLTDEDERPAIRRQAALAVGAVAPATQESISALVSALHSAERTISQSAIYALARLAKRSNGLDDLAELLAIVHDEHIPIDVRSSVASLLPAAGTPAQVAPVLMWAVQHREWWLRVFAARALGELSTLSTDVVPHLARALADEEREVRRNAIYALSRHGVAAGAAISDLAALLDTDLAGLAAEALARIGDAALPALSRTLTTGPEQARPYAAYGLAKLATTEAQTVLTQRNVAAFVPGYADLITPAPTFVLDDAKRAAFAALYDRTLGAASGNTVAYDLPYPKYEFLCYLADEQQLLLHGSNRTDLDILAPIRWATDPSAYANINGVYADPDGLRPFYFAIVNRQQLLGGLKNTFLWGADGDAPQRKYYQLAIDAESLWQAPWTDGMVYVLPRDTFEEATEWTSRLPVRPLIKVPVTPAEFPLLNDICGFDWQQQGWPTFDGDPLLNNVRLYPIQRLTK
jgi:HEAT repeat protein